MSTADWRPENPSRESTSGAQDWALRRTTDDPDEARQIVTEAYLPHRLWVSGVELDMELLSARFGDLTAGLLSYGEAVHLLTDETTQFHVNLTLAGRAASKSGHGETLVTTAGQAVVFAVGEPAQVTWSVNCRQLCLMAPRSRVEGELERLIGRKLREPLTFERAVCTDLSHAWEPALRLVRTELEAPGGLLTRPLVARHIEGLVIDGLLLTQPHNYQDLVQREGPAGTVDAVARAAELLEELPVEPWSVVELARQVGLSVRGLQYGFRRDFDMPPMEYLRGVRLRRAHAALLAASPDSTTVRAIALDCGFLHLGRFAASYRDQYGEAPSRTLARRL